MDEGEYQQKFVKFFFLVEIYHLEFFHILLQDMLLLRSASFSWNFFPAKDDDLKLGTYLFLMMCL